MTTSAPPIRHPLLEQGNVLSMPWVLFFNQTFLGDAGTNWNPTLQNLTEVGGAATVTGRFFQLSRYVTYFNVLITPATNTSSVGGTTYIDNFPLTSSANGVCTSVSNNLGGALGMVDSTTNRIYTPTWTTLATPVNVIGMVEAA